MQQNRISEKLKLLSEKRSESLRLHQKQQERLQHSLSHHIHFNKEEDSAKSIRVSGLRRVFNSSWLPGPLSYPWMVMLASVPQIIKQLFD